MKLPKNCENYIMHLAAQNQHCTLFACIKQHVCTISSYLQLSVSNLYSVMNEVIFLWDKGNKVSVLFYY
jgi:hypothetical protein